MKTIPLNNKLRYLSYISTLTDNIKHNSIQAKTVLRYSTELFIENSNHSGGGYGYGSGNGCGDD